MMPTISPPWPAPASFGRLVDAQILAVAVVDQRRLTIGVDDVEDPEERNGHAEERTGVLDGQEDHADADQEERQAAHVEAVVQIADAGEERQARGQDRVLAAHADGYGSGSGSAGGGGGVGFMFSGSTVVMAWLLQDGSASPSAASDSSVVSVSLIDSTNSSQFALSDDLEVR